MSFSLVEQVAVRSAQRIKGKLKGGGDIWESLALSFVAAPFPEGLKSRIKKPASVVAQDAGSLLMQRSIPSNTQFGASMHCAASVIGQSGDFLTPGRRKGL